MNEQKQEQLLSQVEKNQATVDKDIKYLKEKFGSSYVSFNETSWQETRQVIDRIESNIVAIKSDTAQLLPEHA